MTEEALHEAFARCRAYLAGLNDRRVGATASADDLRARLGGGLPETGTDDATVIRELAEGAEAGLVASSGPSYFGFVVGATLPAALAADWLTATWDQNAGLHVLSPAAAVVESIVAGWLLELLGLPATASVGLVTGCQMANFTCLAAARGTVLRRAGHEPDEAGLAATPPIAVIVGEDAHATIFTALRMLGIGTRQIRVAAVDAEGRMRPEALAALLSATSEPAIVCAQAGNVSSGAVDPLRAIAGLARAHGAWLHVDGAFGLWAGASPSHAHLVDGVAEADSWATDAHKWLNVPYDCGIAAVREHEAHRRAVANTAAAYLVQGGSGQRDGQDWAPESSRRARAFPLYAAIRSLGRAGIAALVERCCALARRMAEHLAGMPGATVLNDVVLNQVLVRFDHPGHSSEQRAGALTAEVIRRIQEDGTSWAGPTTWQGAPAMRVSVSSWRTTAADIDRAATAVAVALGAAQSAG